MATDDPESYDLTDSASLPKAWTAVTIPQAPATGEAAQLDGPAPLTKDDIPAIVEAVVAGLLASLMSADPGSLRAAHLSILTESIAPDPKAASVLYQSNGGREMVKQMIRETVAGACLRYPKEPEAADQLPDGE